MDDRKKKFDVTTDKTDDYHGLFSYNVVVHQSYNRPQKVCCVSSESDLNKILQTWKIAKPGIVFSFCSGVVRPNFKSFKTFLVDTVRLTGAAITVEEPSTNNILKNVVKRIERESDFIPPTIGVVSCTQENDLFKQLHEGECIELTEKWTTLTEFTHLVFVQQSFERERAFSFLNNSISGNVYPAPVVLFIGLTEDKGSVRVKCSKGSDFFQREEPDQYKISLHVWELFRQTVEDFRSQLIESLVDSKSEVSIRTTLKLAVVMKGDFGKVLYRFRDKITHKEKADIIAYAFRTDNWPQAMTVLTVESMKGIYLRTELRPKINIEMLTLFETTLRTMFVADNKQSKDTWVDIEKYYSGISGVNITLSGNHTQDYFHNITLCLFLWAIQHQRFTVANELWRMTKNMMAAALLAYNYIQKMKEDNTTAADDLECLENTATYYNNKAIAILTECSKVKTEYAKNSLVRKRDELGGKSLLQIAKNNKTYISQNTCHSKVNEIWFSPLEPHKKNRQKWLFLLCVFLPFLAPLLQFRSIKAVLNENVESKEDDCNKRQSNVKMYRSRVWDFLHAPIVKFSQHLLTFLIFLVFFAYDLTFGDPEFAWNNGIIFAFVLSFVTEEIRQVYQGGRHYFRNIWNWIDISSLALFVRGQILMITACCSEGGRVLLAVSYIMFSIRLLQVFVCLSQIGPLLVMIARMLVDTVSFLGILTVVVISYAVSSRAVLYPNMTFTWASLYTTFRKPYWHIFGELFLDEIEGAAECVAEGTVINSTDSYPSTLAQYIMPVLLGVYMLIVHVLLLNLLIAKFSYTVTSVQEDTDIHWRYLRFQLVDEYFNRTVIFPPFTFIYHLYLFIFFCKKKMCVFSQKEVLDELSKNYDSFCVTIPERVNTNLQNWENDRAKTVVVDKHWENDRAKTVVVDKHWENDRAKTVVVDKHWENDRAKTVVVDKHYDSSHSNIKHSPVFHNTPSQRDFFKSY